MSRIRKWTARVLPIVVLGLFGTWVGTATDHAPIANPLGDIAAFMVGSMAYVAGFSLGCAFHAAFRAEESTYLSRRVQKDFFGAAVVASLTCFMAALVFGASLLRPNWPMGAFGGIVVCGAAWVASRYGQQHALLVKVDHRYRSAWGAWLSIVGWGYASLSLMGIALAMPETIGWVFALAGLALMAYGSGPAARARRLLG